MDNIFFRSGLFYHFAGKGDRAGGGQDNIAPLEARARRACNVVEAARLTANVIASMAGRDMFIVKAAFKFKIAGRGDFAGTAVVGDGIGLQGAVPEFDLHLTAQGVDVAILFLFAGLDRDRFAFTGRNSRLFARLHLGFRLCTNGLRLADN